MIPRFAINGNNQAPFALLNKIEITVKLGIQIAKFVVVNNIMIYVGKYPM